MEDNLKLWKSVEKTNPNYTKNANVKGNKITSISPQFQIMNATEQFGVYGVTWGFREMNIDYSLKDIGLVSFKATFYFPNGEFQTINSIQLYKDNANTKIDDNFAKKLETDTLTKCLSKLGFNADIFLGKFEDIRYTEELKAEFNKPEPPKDYTRQISMLKSAKTVDEFNIVWSGFTAVEQKALTEEVTPIYNKIPK